LKKIQKIRSVNKLLSFFPRMKRYTYLNKWWFTRLNSRKINQNQLSYKFSNILNEKINIRLLNVFYYMANKQMFNYRTHQDHFWNKGYRRFRFYYDNYYDIVNSFYILGLIKNSDHLLLTILRSMMPRIRKIRRFMYFLDAVIKKMTQIQTKFSCFRITISGKIQGGTKRTKVFSIGYGFLPYQTIYIEGSNAFINYRHKFGEFGIKLILNRINNLWIF
jgi:hypothetical protein